MTCPIPDYRFSPAERHYRDTPLEVAVYTLVAMAGVFVIIWMGGL